VLPDSQHTPASALKRFVNEAIAVPIAPKFPLPKNAIRSWHAAVFGTTVPKATINKDSDALLRKNEIRLSKYAAASAPPVY
jgi:penicillin V acylase-like amidase (Ntn superfamily)